MFLLIFSAGTIANNIEANTDTKAGELPQNLYFDVFLDDKKIGKHNFIFSAIDNGYELNSEASYKVKILGITFFNYQHQSKEHWQNNCLKSIQSNTNSNGDKYSVSSALVNENLKITTQDETFTAKECTRSFVYWEPDLLFSKQLLNSQTGELQELKQSEELNGELRIIKLSGKDMDIELHYKTNQTTGLEQWKALIAKLENGRTLNYRSTKLEGS
ncbi:DUF6134 family protein [uncultured Pseudoteredinibacter sp.]|uniref:DUF6134 family protein n=1 Tax=uncultured Pseudoteredinibacter sp. TaxID=1641701 RepID=UPI002609A087|nr:DUF6134 family protein [uncultured Pseudoteredinibacter sp.]